MTPSPLAPGPRVLTSGLLSEARDVVHGFTTRAAGDARAPDAKEAGGPDAVGRAIGSAPHSNWPRRAVRQVHGADVVVAADGPAPEADGLVSAAPAELLVIRTADCLSVLLVAGDGSGRRRAVGALHGGWRGLVAGVLERGVGALRELVPQACLSAALGPAIGPCCFEIGPDVADTLAGRFGPDVLRPGPRERPHADLPLAARSELARLGVRLDAGPPPPCTRCQPELFHSYRAEGRRAGRMAAYIGMTP